MPSQSPRSEREQERRLNIRTLVIASAAAATAALVTSHLWFAGTWIAAALTPVIVAIVSELLHRPTERIGRPPTRRPATGGESPVRVYRSTAAPRGRRKLALGAVALTAALAFAIAVAAITVPELIAGQSLGNGDKATTLLGGKPRKHRSDEREQTGDQPQTTEQSPTATQPEQTTPEEQPSETAPPATTETVPQTTTPAPSTATTPTSP